MIDAPPGSWARDDFHRRAPTTALAASVWIEPFNQGYAHAFARWGYLGDGIAGAWIGGWFYTGFRALSDPAEAPRRIERAIAVARADEHLAALHHWERVAGPAFQAGRRALAAVDASALKPVELSAHVLAVADAVRAYVCHRFGLLGINELVAEWVLVAEESWGWPPDRALAQLAGTSGVTTAAVDDLAPVLAAARSDRQLAARLDGGERPTLAELRACPDVARALETYLLEHRDRPLTLDLAEPTLGEYPEHAATAVASAWSSAAPPEQAAAATVDPALDCSGPDHPGADHPALKRARLAYPWRDASAAPLLGLMGLLRRVALAAGARLGLPDGEALHLTADELAAALKAGPGPELVDLVAVRRAEHEQAAAHPPPINIGPIPEPPGPSGAGGAALPPEAARAMQRLGLFARLMFGPVPAASSGGRSAGGGSAGGRLTSRVLTGIAAAAGRYTGPARVVPTVSDLARVRPGDVVVCPTTGPAWTFVLARAGALVCDRGGALSHPAIIAREFGIPAVVGVGCATEVLRDGQTVTVDGARGLVEPVGD